MSHIPYFRFFPADFMTGVRGLSAQEVGIYTMLLCRIYEENGPVEYHLNRLSAYCDIRPTTLEKTIGKLVDLGKLTLVAGMLYNSRAEMEITNRANDLKNKSKAGKKSAEKAQQNQRAQSTDVQHLSNYTDTDTDKATLSSVADAPPRDDLDILQSKLLEAAGDEKIQGHGALVVGPIAELVAQGVSLDLDILPTIRAICSRRDRPVSSWSYFVGAIREAFERRVSSGKGLHVPAPVQETEDLWQRRLRWARANRKWETSAAGPMPGRPGCRVPQHLLQDSDGDGWHDMDDDRRPSLTLVHNNRQARHA